MIDPFDLIVVLPPKERKKRSYQLSGVYIYVPGMISVEGIAGFLQIAGKTRKSNFPTGDLVVCFCCRRSTEKNKKQKHTVLQFADLKSVSKCAKVQAQSVSSFCVRVVHLPLSVRWLHVGRYPVPQPPGLDGATAWPMLKIAVFRHLFPLSSIFHVFATP